MAKPQRDDYIPDMETLRYMAQSGISNATSSPAKLDRMPSTAAGLPSLRVRDLHALEGTNLLGFILDSNRVKDADNNRRREQTVFKAPSAGADTAAHEIEHLLARQNLGHSVAVRDKFKELLEQGELVNPGLKALQKSGAFRRGLIEALPYLKEKYGLDNAYMSPRFINEDGHVGMYEILATLASAESSQNVDLTKDPELRKTLFKDKDVREAYNAVTGLRQTRLDPRDIPPYTRIPEKEQPGVASKLKQLIGFANGGAIPNAGNQKLI